MSQIEWWRKGVFYQVYPRSFMDQNGDGIGDLAGITDRLGYIAKLGVDGIWISPFFHSPMKDFGYDVSDYRAVDPLFGTNEDFDVLLKRSHELGMRVIVDMVLSHTSIDHHWFVESRLSSDNRKADWYVWADAKEDGSPPNNWQSIFGGPAWTFDTRRGQYYLHNFLKEQPDLNYHSPLVQKQILSECEYWLERGVDGFRLDTVNFYVHDKELRNNPPRDEKSFSTGVQVDKPYPYTMQQHLYDKSRPENLKFLKKLRALMDKYPETMTLGEIGDDDPYKLAGLYTSGDEYLHTTYNTHLISGTKASSLSPETIIEPFEEFAKQESDGWPSWAFSNHDVVRSATRWGKGIKNKDDFAKLLMKLLLSLRGTPFIYQGEELGLSEASIPFEMLQDPWGIYLWPEWQGRDGCRTPIPWTSEEPHAGFSRNKKTETWLPIPYEHRERDVETQINDKNSVLKSTEEFIAWRKTKPALQIGDLEFSKTNNKNILAFNRILDKEKILCVFNLSEEDQEFNEICLKPLECFFKEI